MAILVSCQSISKSFGAQQLFSNISFGFSDGERCGLIGSNGSGKSTMLKILSGLEETDTGTVSVKNDCRMVYLAQEDKFDPELSVEEVVSAILKGEIPEEVERYTRVKRVLGKCEFSNPGQLTKELSGGWKKRLSIACALAQEPDLLLMDEPTNHLDIEGIIWLERLLNTAQFAFVLVSHDRYFLENCTNRIIDLSKRYPEGYLKIEGNYSKFLEERENFLQALEQRQEVLSNKVRRETEWLRRGPKARTSKARYRIDEAYRLQDELAEVKQLNSNNKKVDLDFDATKRKTKKLVEAIDLKKSLGGTQLFEKVNFQLSPGKRLGLLGRNGTGKSTIMRLLNGKLNPDEGEVKLAEGVKVVTFDQSREQLNQENTLRKELSPSGDNVIYRGKTYHVSGWAKRFLFQTDQLEVPVHCLSGGEQARILLARLMQQSADVLLLDEPTNDLDIPSLEVLEESLMDFPGAIVIVSHDRYLLDKVTDNVLGLDGEGGAELFYDYTEWLRLQKERDKQKKKALAPAKPKVQEKPERKLSYKEKKELEVMEETILEAEDEVETAQAALQSPEVMADSDKLQEACKTLEDAQKRVEYLYQRWEELEGAK